MRFNAPTSMCVKLLLPFLLLAFLCEGTAWCAGRGDDPLVVTANILGEDNQGLSKAQGQAAGGSARFSAEITTLPIAEVPSQSPVSTFSAMVHRGGLADFELLAWKLGIGGLTRSPTDYSGGFLGFAVGVSHVNPRTHSEAQASSSANTTVSMGDQYVPAAGIYLDGFQGGKKFGAHVFVGWTFLSQVSIDTSLTTTHPSGNTVARNSGHVDWGILSLGVGLSFVL